MPCTLRASCRRLCVFLSLSIESLFVYVQLDNSVWTPTLRVRSLLQRLDMRGATAEHVHHALTFMALMLVRALLSLLLSSDLSLLHSRRSGTF